MQKKPGRVRRMENWSLFTHLSYKLHEHEDKSKVPTSCRQNSQLPPFLFLDLKHCIISTSSFFHDCTFPTFILLGLNMSLNMPNLILLRLTCLDHSGLQAIAFYVLYLLACIPVCVFELVCKYCMDAVLRR